MRIAVVQLATRPNERTRTLQAALGAIDAAAKKDPAPDLILLPAFADVPAAALGKKIVCEHVHGQTSAGCGQRSRNWGVFTVFGLAEKGPHKPYVATVLLDRDGDIRLSQRQVSFDRSITKNFDAGDGFRTVKVLLGCIAPLTGDDLFNAQDWDAAVRGGAQIVLGTACWFRRKSDCQATTGDIHSRIGEQAGRCGLWCAVADTAPFAENGGLIGSGLSAVFNQEGEIVVAAEAGAATTLWANITMPCELKDVSG